MRGVLYSVAMRLDGYIAGPEGDYDWIPDESDIDRGRFLGRFDTVLTGRGTREVVTSEGGVVDGVEAAVVPILLGDGIPFLPATGERARLEPGVVQRYPTTGLVLLSYDVA